jgi:HPr kinase/phosphorylase
MSMTVRKFFDDCGDALQIELLAGGDGLAREVLEPRVQKSGLAITGEVASTHDGRIQVLGETELTWFSAQAADRAPAIADRFFAFPMSCALVGGGLPVPPLFVEAADRHGVPLFISPLGTSDLINEAVRFLEQQFAETTTIHGVLLEILGVGLVLMGRSGIGKSECALDLIQRGYRFVADDVVHVEKRGAATLLGRGGDLTRHHMEIRGLGIINVRDLFGPSAITACKKLELIVHLEEWDATKEYDRLGLDDGHTAILEVPIPSLLIPVSPGRNLATLVEVAVRNHLLKAQGIHSARDLVEQQARRMGGEGGFP